MAISGLQAVALLAGSFLSGAMAALSFIAVPVFLDTTENAPQLFHQWARTYNYGHQALPTMAVGTCILHFYTARSKRRSSSGQRALIFLAGVTTVMMLPFTWFFMTPTNNELFRLEALVRTEPEFTSFSEARELVVHWAQLHAVRCLFPLAGAILCAFGTF